MKTLGLSWSVPVSVDPAVKKIILLFIGSFLVVFSASLKVFFQEVSWREVLIKGLLIPCFTWTDLTS